MSKKLGKTETVSGRALVQISSVSPYLPTAVWNVNPIIAFSGGSGVSTTTYGADKLTSLSDCFQYFRFRRLRFRLLGSYSSAPALLALGYAPDESVAGPSDLNGVLNLPWVSDVLFSNNSSVTSAYVPSTPSWNTIPAKMLLDQNIKWWRTRTDVTVDDQLEYQGRITIARGGFTLTQDTTHVDIEYTCEFKNFIAPAFTPKKALLEAKDVAADDDYSDCADAAPALANTLDPIPPPTMKDRTAPDSIRAAGRK